jgi:hypothetical protein
MSPLLDISKCVIRGCRIEDIAKQAGYTPEERLLLAVIVQAVLDALKPTDEGRDARAFLQDPDVQSLTQVLWGVRTSGHFDRRRAVRAINAYRTGYGQKLQHRRKSRG